MDKMTKSERDKLYNATQRKRFGINLSNEEYANFHAYCTKIGVIPTAYIKKLVNEDVTKRGDEPFFRVKKD